MRGGQVPATAVAIAGIDHVAVDDRHSPYPGPANEFGGKGTDAAHTHHQDMRLLQFFQLSLPINSSVRESQLISVMQKYSLKIDKNLLLQMP